MTGPALLASVLSWEGVVFLLTRTDFHEPWMGIGFATEMKKQLLETAAIKADDPVKIGVLAGIKKDLGE